MELREEQRGQEQENPYLSARKEYGDRYGSAVKDAARWRQISILMVVLCFAFGGVMMWLAAQNKVVPYIVQVDKQGYAVAIRSSQEGSVADTRVIIAALGGFIRNFKTTVMDTAAQRRMIDATYAYLAKGSSAESTVSRWYQANNPYAPAQSRRDPVTQVEIRSVVRAGGDSDRSWQILWTEEKVDSGAVTSREEWRAIISIAVSPVQDLADVLKNPLGIYVTEINMVRDIARAE